MATKKIVCIGGAGQYFSKLLPNLVMCQDLNGSEVVLFDLMVERAKIMAALGNRLSKEAGTKYRIRATGDLSDALDGADFAISAIGGSGAWAGVKTSPYHCADISIPAKRSNISYQYARRFAHAFGKINLV